MAIDVGNVKKTKLRDIVFSKEFMKFKSDLKKNGTLNGCNRCGYLKIRIITKALSKKDNLMGILKNYVSKKHNLVKKKLS